MHTHRVVAWLIADQYVSAWCQLECQTLVFAGGDVLHLSHFFELALGHLSIFDWQLIGCQVRFKNNKLMVQASVRCIADLERDCACLNVTNIELDRVREQRGFYRLLCVTGAADDAECGHTKEDCGAWA